MSGIVGGLNTRGSGLINIGSATDGQVFTGTGAGLPTGFEAAAGGGIWNAVTATASALQSELSVSVADTPDIVQILYNVCGDDTTQY